MDIMQYITEQCLVLIPVLNILGYGLKTTASIPDKYIPIILLVVGIMASIGVMGVSVQAVIQGVLITGASVYGHQVVNQLTKKEE